MRKLRRLKFSLFVAGIAQNDVGSFSMFSRIFRQLFIGQIREIRGYAIILRLLLEIGFAQ